MIIWEKWTLYSSIFQINKSTAPFEYRPIQLTDQPKWETYFHRSKVNYSTRSDKYIFEPERQIFSDLATILQESRGCFWESAGEGRGAETGTMRRGERKKQIATSASHYIIPIFPMGRQWNSCKREDAVELSGYHEKLVHFEGRQYGLRSR